MLEADFNQSRLGESNIENERTVPGHLLLSLPREEATVTVLFPLMILFSTPCTAPLQLHREKKSWGFDRHGFDRHCFDRRGFVRRGFVRRGFVRRGFVRNCFDRRYPKKRDLDVLVGFYGRRWEGDLDTLVGLYGRSWKIFYGCEREQSFGHYGLFCFYLWLDVLRELQTSRQ